MKYFVSFVLLVALVATGALAGNLTGVAFGLFNTTSYCYRLAAIAFDAWFIVVVCALVLSLFKRVSAELE